MKTTNMDKWKIQHIEFTLEIRGQIKAFVDQNPTYRKMMDDRINDLLNFPDLYFQEAFIEEDGFGYFVTKGQQIELAGEARKESHTILITHLGFHR